MASSINASTSGAGGVITTADSSGVLNIQTAGNTAVTVDASQNVGIGTSSPAHKLDVAGSLRLASVADILANTTGAGSLAISAGTSYNAGGTIVFRGSTNSTNPYGLEFNTNGTERMRITSAGEVYIGGSTAAAGPVILSKGGAGGGSIITFFKPNSGATNVILNYYVATYVGGMNMDNTSTSFITSSDIRLKKDIVDAPSATQKIDNIRIVSHGWKHDEAVVDFGIIAQDLYEIMPRAVTKGDDNEEVETVWSVDYSKLVPMLIKAHQEQQNIINDLKARVETLEAK
jgi:hypothetical protein